MLRMTPTLASVSWAFVSHLQPFEERLAPRREQHRPAAGLTPCQTQCEQPIQQRRTESPAEVCPPFAPIEAGPAQWPSAAGEGVEVDTDCATPRLTRIPH